jgi:hypothetical protein
MCPPPDMRLKHSMPAPCQAAAKLILIKGVYHSLEMNQFSVYLADSFSRRSQVNLYNSSA